ncbi:MAG: FliI/YscN family ATPase [Planctomycetota bacterium]
METTPATPGPSPLSAAERVEAALNATHRPRAAQWGHVIAVTGTLVRAAVPDVAIGERCAIERPDDEPLTAEVIGFDGEGVLLMPLGDLTGVPVKTRVRPEGKPPMVPAGDRVRGRVLDALGNPLDDGPPLDPNWPLMGRSPHPLKRDVIRQSLPTGVTCIDAALTVGVGQRVGIFAGAGVGKSTLLSMIARGVEADRIVLALIGERGREVRQFIEDDLGPRGLERCTVVVSTSDQPAMLRLKSAYTATAIAEEARSRGERVLLMMDSVTRFARALREIGLAAGEAPGRQGYPASVFATLPVLFERAGNDGVGSITAFYTVLVAGNDFTEPVCDETMSLLDGHLVLTPKLGSRGHFPAIDLAGIDSDRPSVSRVMAQVAGPEHQRAAQRLRKVLKAYEDSYDKITCGVYEPGSDPRVDYALQHIDAVNAFLHQGTQDLTAFDDNVKRLIDLLPPAPDEG